LTGATGVTGGAFHSCARFPNGTLQCWGRNSDGQLGAPATTGVASPRPVPVTDITTATVVTGGGYHTCALLQNGTVRCWGQNDYGQLGDGTLTPTIVPNRTPVQVFGITTAVVVSAGGFHTCALLADSTIRCWGQNNYGQLGDGTTTNAVSPITTPASPRPTPMPATVTGITTAVAVEAGALHTCALLRDGTLRCWGDNGYGQLGNGSQRGIYAPSEAPAVTGITTAVAATSGAEHTCALLRDGRVQCWGRGLFGRLGDGRDRNSPEGD